MLKEINVYIDGKLCVIAGRSSIVGKSLAEMMTRENATVVLCHSHTPVTLLDRLAHDADIFVSAVGQKDFIDSSKFKDGAVVIDKKILAHLDVGAVITIKGRIDKSALRLSQQFLYHLSDPVKVGTVHHVQPLEDPPAHLLFLHHRLIRDVGQLQVSFFDIIHLHSSFLIPF